MKSKLVALGLVALASQASAIHSNTRMAINACAKWQPLASDLITMTSNGRYGSKYLSTPVGISLTEANEFHKDKDNFTNIANLVQDRTAYTEEVNRNAINPYPYPIQKVGPAYDRIGNRYLLLWADLELNRGTLLIYKHVTPNIIIQCLYKVSYTSTRI